MFPSRRIAILFTVLAACGQEPTPQAPSAADGDDNAERDAGPGDADEDDAARAPDGAQHDDAGEPGEIVDPLARQPDSSEGLVNVSADLGELLEQGALATACDEYRAAPRDRRAKLRCGKAMFFWEGFGTLGVPATLVHFLIDNFPDQIGGGFSKLGMIEDPTSETHLPLGLAPGAILGASVETYAFTCASCHFGRLPDGRYAVGAPNHDYQYGRQNLSLMLVPLLGLGASAADHDPDAVAAVKPLLDVMQANPGLSLSLTSALLPLVTGGASVPNFTRETEHHYASWKAGTMDFFIAPLPFDDGVHTISKISALWGIPTNDEVAASGMHHGMLGVTGGTSSLENFVAEFVDLGGGKIADWPDDKLAPLAEYIYSLRPPENPAPAKADEVERGARLFSEKACSSCHDGPRGSGKKLYSYAELGTDPQMQKWADPEQTGMPCCNLRFRPGDELTHSLKAPRLVGEWTMQRFLHNGSVDSLEALFCLGSQRPTISEVGYADSGHMQTCTDLDDEEKHSLITYLRAR
ncbi:MAG: hypothetical protein QM778_33335 [Myxococcales bacterium]